MEHENAEKGPSSSLSDRGRDKQRHKRRRKRSRSSSSSSSSYSSSSSSSSYDSSSSSSGRHRKSKRREKKKSKNHRRHKSKKDKKRKRSSTSYPEISSDDFFRKSVQFRQWLLETKGFAITDLTSEQAKIIFSNEFVIKWNRGDLDGKFYGKQENGDSAASSNRPVFQWSVGGSRSSSEPNIGVNAISEAQRQREEAEEEAERRRAERRAADKKYKKRRREDVDEIVPKETGRDALREKKKFLTQMRRDAQDEKGGEDVIDPFDDGSDPIKSKMMRQELARERSQQRREEELNARKQEFAKKEQEKLDQLRMLARQSGYQV